MQSEPAQVHFALRRAEQRIIFDTRSFPGLLLALRYLTTVRLRSDDECPEVLHYLCSGRSNHKTKG
jgi:hypothetical protein